MPEEIELKAEQVRLFRRTERLFTERLENKMNVANVLFNGLRPNDYVVEVNMTDLTDEVAQCGEHLVLVCGRRIAASHWHYRPLIKTERRGDGG